MTQDSKKQISYLLVRLFVKAYIFITFSKSMKFQNNLQKVKV